MILFKLAYSLILPSYLGHLIIQRIFVKRKLPALLSVALGYGLGMGLLSQWILFLGAIGVRYHSETIGLPLSFLVIAIFFVNKRTLPAVSLKPSGPKLSKKDFDTAIYLMAGFILFHIIFAFWNALNIPILGWDCFATNVFKAKILFFEKSLALQKNFPHPTYPLHTIFLDFWINLNLGVWHDQLFKITYTLYYLFLLIIVYFFLKYFTNMRWSFIGVMLLVSSNLFTFHATEAYRDIVMSYYNSIAVMLLLLWKTEKDDGFLILAALFSGFCTFVKSDGAVYMCIHFAVLFVMLFTAKDLKIQIKIKKLIKFISLSFSIWLLYCLHKYLAIKLKMSMPHDVTYDLNVMYFMPKFSVENMRRIPIMANLFFQHLFFSGSWNILWFLFIISVMNFREIRRKYTVKILITSVLMFWGALILVLFFSCYYNDSVAALGDPISRTALHSFPLVILTIVLINAPPAKLPEKV